MKQSNLQEKYGKLEEENETLRGDYAMLLANADADAMTMGILSNLIDRLIEGLKKISINRTGIYNEEEMCFECVHMQNIAKDIIKGFKGAKNE